MWAENAHVIIEGGFVAIGSQVTFCDNRLPRVAGATFVSFIFFPTGSVDSDEGQSAY